MSRRVFAGGVATETNVFAGFRTTLADFARAAPAVARAQGLEYVQGP